VSFVARAGAKLVAYNWVRLRPGVDDGDMIHLVDGQAFHLDFYRKRMLSMATRGNFMPPLFRQGSTRCEPAAMDPTFS
jgi:hypothetical protein